MSIVIDLQINDLTMPKEIHWDMVEKNPTLHVEMMRNRVKITATASYATMVVYESTQIMWSSFVRETRKYLDGNNVGMYAITIEERFHLDKDRVYFGSDYATRKSNMSEGVLNLYFEDSGDYARFLKERAVMFKLSSINTL